MLYFSYSKERGAHRCTYLNKVRYNIMKTQEQINATVDRINAYINKVDRVYKWKQFGSKQCWVSDCIGNRYFLVKSYSTIVAIIDDQTGELFELGKWSVTTSKQVTQLYNLSDTESYRKFGFSKLEKRYLVK